MVELEERNNRFRINFFSIRWKFLRHRTWVAFSGIAFLLLFLGLVWSFQKTREEGAFAKIENLKENWFANSLERESLLPKIEAQTALCPEGFSAWKGSLLQSALLLERVDWIEKWRLWPTAKPSCKISPLSSLVESSAKVALLSGQKRWLDALSSVQKILEKPLEIENEAERIVLAQLYLQKATLALTLQQLEKEKEAWGQLLSFLELSITPSFQGLSAKENSQLLPDSWQERWVESWSEEKVTLLDYIAYRLALLSA